MKKWISRIYCRYFYDGHFFLKRFRKVLVVFGLALVAIPMFQLMAWAVSLTFSSSVRMPASHGIVSLEHFSSTPFFSSGAFRSLIVAQASSKSLVQEQQGIISFGEQGLRFMSVYGVSSLGSTRKEGWAPLAFDPAIVPVAVFAEGEYAALRFGQQTPKAQLLKNISSGQTAFVCRIRPNGKDSLSLIKQRLQQGHLSSSSSAHAARYREAAKKYGEQYQLSSGLILAIMHTESNFNPFAVSPRQALGLMQVVQDTAGGEVYRYLTGRTGQPSLETLLHPESNIKYGTVYLHLLGTRYFQDVQSRASRELCIIAAYNCGPGATMRIFADTSEAAIAQINRMTPEEVWETLVTKLPTSESRRYVSVVLGHMQSYQ